MLPSTEMDDLPVVVKFILQSICDSDAFEVRVNIVLNLACFMVTAIRVPKRQVKSQNVFH